MTTSTRGRLDYHAIAATLTPHELVLFQRHLVLLDSGCVEWSGSVNERGYGKWSIKRSGRYVNLYAHRLVAVLAGQQFTPEQEIDHLCRNRRCANPDHLEPVTGKENQHRSPITNATKTECPAGHPYAGDNVLVSASGGRYCRTCNTEACRRYYRENAAKLREAKRLAYQASRAA